MSQVSILFSYSDLLNITNWKVYYADIYYQITNFTEELFFYFY